MPIAYDSHCDSEPHQTVLLSSGLGGSASYWQAQIPALIRAGYQAITYDHRGTGRSAAELAMPYSITDMVQDVLEVLESAGVDRVHFVGHALGALVGLQLARDAPQRLHSLSLVNAWTQLSRHTQRCFQARVALLNAHGAHAYAAAQPLFLYPADWCEQHAVRIEDEVRATIGHFPAITTLLARIDALSRFDASGYLDQLRVPAFVLASRDDMLVPFTCSQQLCERLPGASAIELLRYGGHAVNVTAADEFNQWLLSSLSTLAEPASIATAQHQRA